jgi:hypothetical protein
MLRDISPNAAAHAAFCEAENIRDWRRKGFLDGIGVHDGKGHLYSREDLACLAIGYRLGRCGLPFRDAFSIVRERRNQINAMLGQVEQLPSSDADYVLTVNIDPNLSGGIASVTAAPIAKIFYDQTCLSVIQVNLTAIARSAIHRVETYERAGSAV